MRISASRAGAGLVCIALCFAGCGEGGIKQPDPAQQDEAAPPSVNLNDVFKVQPQASPPGTPGSPGSPASPRSSTPGAPGQPAAGADGPITEANVMDMLASDDRNMVRGVLLQIVARQDARFVPVILELMRLEPMRQQRGVGMAAWVFALEALTDQSIGASWPTWASWYGSTTIQPPAGFTAFKGKLFARIDPKFAPFFAEGTPSELRPEFITWSGIPMGGVPSLDNPKTIAAADASFLTPDEPVFGLVVGDEARAYPLRIMDWHEICNDVVAGAPLSIAYCTMSNAAVAYETRVEGQPEPITFGTSGLIYQSNKLMFDPKTQSLWNQMTGKPVQGPLHGKVPALKRLPLVTARWKDWLADHPQTKVLSRETGIDRPYELGAPYGNYFASPGLMFPLSRVDTKAPPKLLVYSLARGEAAKAYPVPLLAEKRVINDAVGDAPVTLIALRGIIDVHAHSEQTRSDITYAAGAEVRAYERGKHTFSAGEKADEVKDETGATWKVTEAALVSSGSEQLPRITGQQSYWFAWFIAHPDSAIELPPTPANAQGAPATATPAGAVGDHAGHGH